MAHEVFYYGIPGRGESTRLMLAIGGIDFTDTAMDSKEWKEGRKFETVGFVLPLYITY